MEIRRETQADHPAGRAARRRGAGIGRSRLCAGGRPRRAGRQQREPARQRPGAAGVLGMCRQHTDLGDTHRDEKRKWKGRRKHMSKRSFLKLLVGGVMLPATAMLAGAPAQAQNPAEVKVGLLVPLSGIYARPGAVMRMGAEMAIERINAQGGIKALGGAKLKLVAARFRRYDREGQERRAAHGGAGDRPGGCDRLVSQLVHARRHRGDRARQPADADPVLFGHDHRRAASSTSSRPRPRPARRRSSRCR